MSDTVITVDSLSKSYKIGLKERHGRTFREMATDVAMSPIRRIRSLATGGSGSAPKEETFWALKDVSFEVKRGEVVGIIGRNGAGKSTLLKILSRITEPTSGEVRLRGRVASLLEVGTGFHPELTGRENIYLNGAILGMKRAEITRKFDEIVAFAEVEKFLDTPVKFYSSGMYVRLAFAVAAHLEPEILIVDEVLAVGDAEFQKKCLGKMQEVSKGQGRTVLFVSHNLAAIEGLCTKALVLKGGQPAYFGGVAEGVNSYVRPDGGNTGRIPACSGIGIDVHHGEASPGDAQVFRSFEDLHIDLTLTPTVDVYNLGMQIFIETATGYSVAELDTAPFHPRLALNNRKQTVVRLTLRALPLRPGEYRIRLILRDDGKFNYWEIPYSLGVRVEPSLEPQFNTRNQSPMGATAISFGREIRSAVL
jgi:lipopolysaccharide transport system ATP-binding protein